MKSVTHSGRLGGRRFARTGIARPLAAVSLVLGVLSAGGCGSDAAVLTAPSESELGTTASSSVQDAAIDLGGTWTWTETVTTIFPPLIAEILGITPEGPVTHATCYDNGTLTLAQSGNTFDGTATQTSTCTTNGGQQYTPPFPPTLDVLDGRIDGSSIDFSFSDGCPYHGTVSLEGGIAVQIGGTGKCEIMLHPALLKTVTWQATR
jgi:hypothetical protein